MKPTTQLAACPPKWALEVLSCPDCRSELKFESNRFVCSRCGEVGSWRQGIASFAVDHKDPVVSMYESFGGPTLYDRMKVPYTNSALDAPVFHAFVRQIRPASKLAPIVDIAAGDGRNTEVWLDWGYRRVVATDAIAPALMRIRDRLAKHKPHYLDRLLLVQTDTRNIPLRPAAFRAVAAIEALGFVDTDYERCLDRCAELLTPGGKIVVADPSYEGSLLTSVLYHGLEGMLRVKKLYRLPYEQGKLSILSRLFTEKELIETVRRAGLKILASGGTSLLATIIGMLRSQDKLGPGAEKLLPAVEKLLMEVGQTGVMHRINVVVAQKPARRARRR